jgi:hypothetical protein
VCEQNPTLVPVVAPLNLKLPKPVDTCITKEIVLPRVKCQKVSAVYSDPVFVRVRKIIRFTDENRALTSIFFISYVSTTIT